MSDILLKFIFPLFFFFPFCIIEKPQKTNPRVVSFMKTLRAVEAEPTNASAPSSQAKQYSRIKLTLSLIGTAISFILTLAIVVTGFSLRVENFVHSYTQSPYGALLYSGRYSVCSAASFLSRSVFIPASFSSIGIIYQTRVSSNGYGNKVKHFLSASRLQCRSCFCFISF